MLSMTSAVGALCGVFLALAALAGCAPVSSEPAAPARPVAAPQTAASRQEPAAAFTQAPTPAAASSGDESAVSPPEPVTELPAGTTVLHIGDSFAGALGIDLNREL